MCFVCDVGAYEYGVWVHSSIGCGGVRVLGVGEFEYWVWGELGRGVRCWGVFGILGFFAPLFCNKTFKGFFKTLCPIAVEVKRESLSL